jgi:hypothetical protein
MKHNVNATVVLDESTEEERERARDLYGSDDVEIDENARASRGEGGTWIAAWVWLGDES